MHTRTVLLEVASLKRSNKLKNRARNKQQESATPAQTQPKISSESMKHYAPGVSLKPAFKTVNQADFELCNSRE
jgi:hypothetical protein